MIDCYFFAAISALVPTQGIDTGNHVVNVFGDNFHQNNSYIWECSFGSAIAPAQRHSDTRLTCTSPGGTAGETVNFSVLLNGDPIRNFNSLQFTFIGELYQFQKEN
jgi:hypothetical protein